MHARYFPNRYKDYEGALGSCEYARELVPNLLKIIEDRSPPGQGGESGLYVGSAGIGYAFYAVATNAAFKERREEYLKKSLQYVQVIVAIVVGKTVLVGFSVFTEFCGHLGSE